MPVDKCRSDALASTINRNRRSIAGAPATVSTTRAGDVAVGTSGTIGAAAGGTAGGIGGTAVTAGAAGTRGTAGAAGAAGAAASASATKLTEISWPFRRIVTLNGPLG